MATNPRTGRRRGPSGTRDSIAAAAREAFADAGYERATIRAIAERAGVDPALVLHFFGSKQELFVAVTELPFDPELVMPEVLAGPRSALGERFARFVVGMLENPESRSVMTGIVRSAASGPEAAELVRDVIATRIIGALSANLDADDAPLRASLVGSQVIGLVMARYVVRVEPLASLDADAVVAALAPNLQRYLTKPLA